MKRLLGAFGLLAMGLTGTRLWVQSGLGSQVPDAVAETLCGGCTGVRSAFCDLDGAPCVLEGAWLQCDSGPGFDPNHSLGSTTLTLYCATTGNPSTTVCMSSWNRVVCSE
jgi:hypothetical protein